MRGCVRVALFLMLKSRTRCWLACTLFILPLSQAQVEPQYTIATVAGNGSHGFGGDGGMGVDAALNYPQGLALDSSGNLYIADCFNHRVRKLTPAGVITTIAGNGESGYSGDGGAGTSARLSSPCGLTLDNSGNLFIADSANHVIRKLTPGGTISTYAGNGFAGFAGDGGPATSAQLSVPLGLAVDSRNNLYIADALNSRIRKVAADGIITSFAGTGEAGYSGDGGAALDARLNHPQDVAVDTTGTVFIADSYNHRIRRVTPDFAITTVAGNASGGYAGDGKSATEASLYYPKALDVDASGRIAIADTFNSRIRMVTAEGVMLTVAGNGSFGESGDGGPATNARLRFPSGVVLSDGYFYIADDQNSRIRQLTRIADPASDLRW